MTKLKLEIELVPQTAWYKNLRSLVKGPLWNELRQAVYRRYNYRCGICGARGKLNCHEVWHYDDSLHIQKLQDFIALCDLCHHVKHIGLAGVLAQRGQLNFDRVIEHFKRVNDCSDEVFWKCHEEAFKLWEKRSLYTWKMDLSQLDLMISQLLKEPVAENMNVYS